MEFSPKMQWDKQQTKNVEKGLKKDKRISSETENNQ